MPSSKSISPNAILVVVLTVYLMILLDLSIVYTGMPEIGRAMSMSPVMQTWVQNAYLLCFGGFLLLSAKLGDQFGRRNIMQFGILLFTISSLVIGAAQLSVELIAARAVQGVGASILAPSVLAIISSTFAEGSERMRALTWYSVVAGAGSSLGMVLGGLFAGVLADRIADGIDWIGQWYCDGAAYRRGRAWRRTSRPGFSIRARQCRAPIGRLARLSVLIVVFAASASSDPTGTEQVRHQISAVLVGAAAMNLVALVLAAVFILPAAREARRAPKPAAAD